MSCSERDPDNTDCVICLHGYNCRTTPLRMTNFPAILSRTYVNQALGSDVQSESVPVVSVRNNDDNDAVLLWFIMLFSSLRFLFLSYLSLSINCRPAIRHSFYKAFSSACD